MHCASRACFDFFARARNLIVNRIIWLVGAVVIVLFILGYLGLR